MKSLSLVVLSLALGACSSGDSDAREDVRDETVGAEIASDYNRQMQRAREVELQIDQQKRDLDAALDESVQGRKDP